MTPRRVITLLLLVGAVGCGSKSPISRVESPKDPVKTKPVGQSEASPKPNSSPFVVGNAVPTKLYAAGLMATADLPPGVDVRGKASYQTYLRFREDFVLYISPSDSRGNRSGGAPFPQVLAAEKKLMTKFLAEDVDGFISGDNNIFSLHRQVKIGDVEYEMSCSSVAKDDVLLAYAVARSIRQTPEDSAAATKSESAWNKFVEDDNYGLHPGTDGVLARPEDQPTDSAFNALKDVAYIRTLWLNAGGTITPAGLKAALGPNIFGFYSRGDWFDDSFAKSLTGNTTLRTLSLGSKTLSDEGCKQLTGLVNVWSVEVISPNLTGESVSIFLPMMTRVEELTLSCPKLTNTIVPALAKLDRLENLNLSGTGITDDAIVDLARIPKLKFLNVRRTKISSEGVKKLRAAKKDMNVYSDFK